MTSYTHHPVRWRIAILTLLMFAAMC